MIKEDIDLLEQIEIFEDMDELSFRYFSLFSKLSEEKDPVIRKKSASLIARFLNGKAKIILFRLAQDNDNLVRLEAYEALSSFVYEDVELFLREAIQTEKDDLARSYVIMAWADVAVSLENDMVNKKRFLQVLRSSEKDDDSQLSCCYAQYIFGDKYALEEMFEYLKRDDPGTRFSVLTLLEPEENKERIKKAVKLLLEVEDDVKVINRATELLADIEKKEKLDLLIEFEQLTSAPEKYLPIFYEFSYDDDSFIRTEVALFVVNYVNDKGKKILLRLAQDKDATVRCVAYDSLSVFFEEEVEVFLERVLQTEEDDLARGCSINSWIDVVSSLNHSSIDKMNLLQEIKAKEKNDHVLLSCCYAQYVLGDENTLDELISYLQHENGTIRCAAANELKAILSEHNSNIIKKAIATMLKTEVLEEVRLEAVEALEGISYDDVEYFLREAILSEGNDCIRGCTICSWADIAASLDHNSEENLDFIRGQKEVEKSAPVLLGWCYAQYLLGDGNTLGELLTYLFHENIAVRKTTLDLLGFLVDDNNKQEILKSLRSLLDIEETVEINDLARDLLLTVNYR